jgi:ferredoxin-NADP reductase
MLDESFPHSCRIIDASDLSPGVRRIQFAPDRELAFEPGQHLRLRFAEASGVTALRTYSLASCHGNILGESPYQLWVSRRDPLAASLRPGDSFRASDGAGSLFLPEGRDPLVLIATGTGLAPFRSWIVSDRLAARPAGYLHVVHGVRSQQDRTDAELFSRRGFQLHACLPEPELHPQRKEERILRLLASLIPRLHPGCFFAICGHYPMVAATREYLESSAGIPRSRLLTELPEIGAKADRKAA